MRVSIIKTLPLATTNPIKNIFFSVLKLILFNYIYLSIYIHIYRSSLPWIYIWMKGEVRREIFNIFCIRKLICQFILTADTRLIGPEPGHITQGVPTTTQQHQGDIELLHELYTLTMTSENRFFFRVRRTCKRTHYQIFGCKYEKLKTETELNL